ncbi:MAG: methyl-accepting chemotaxis protein [Salinibacter sp.]
MIEQLRKSIRGKLSVGFAVPFVVLVLFATIYYPLNQRESTLDAARNQARALSEMVALSVGTGLADSNYGLVKKTFSWATDDPNVRYVAILDKNDEVLFNYNPEELQVDKARLLRRGEMIREGGLLRTSRPIEYDGDRYGNVILAYSLEEAMAQIWWNVAFAVIVNLLILGGGIGGVLWLSGRISGRIERLRDGAQAVSAGNLDVEVPVSTDDELGHLADGFNTMVGDIRNAREALENEKASVKEAVRESERQKEHLEESVDTMLRAMDRFADGDLTVQLPTSREGAIGRLFEGFNEAVNNLHRIVQKVREATASTTSATNQISTSSEQMAASVEEQSAQAEEVAAAVEELNQTINENARSVQHTADAAQAGSQQVHRGGEVVEETTEKMEEIAGLVENAADTIEQLGTSSEEIGQVVDRIDEIAEQTNLLALNAAIEAARAGEEGKGFAVVAEEVRELAEEADAATDEIADMIEQVQSETDQAVEVVREGTDRVDEGLELAEEAGEALEEIFHSIKKVEERTDEVAAASEEQSDTSEEIAQSVQSISTAAQQSATGVTQMSRTADELDVVTERLRENVQQFHLGGETGKENTGKRDTEDGVDGGPVAGQYGGDGYPSDDAPL